MATDWQGGRGGSWVWTEADGGDDNRDAQWSEQHHRARSRSRDVSTSWSEAVAPKVMPIASKAKPSDKSGSAKGVKGKSSKGPKSKSKPGNDGGKGKGTAVAAAAPQGDPWRQDQTWSGPSVGSETEPQWAPDECQDATGGGNFKEHVLRVVRQCRDRVDMLYKKQHGWQAHNDQKMTELTVKVESLLNKLGDLVINSGTRHDTTQQRLRSIVSVVNDSSTTLLAVQTQHSQLHSAVAGNTQQQGDLATALGYAQAQHAAIEYAIKTLLAILMQGQAAGAAQGPEAAAPGVAQGDPPAAVPAAPEAAPEAADAVPMPSETEVESSSN